MLMLYLRRDGFAQIDNLDGRQPSPLTQIAAYLEDKAVNSPRILYLKVHTKISRNQSPLRRRMPERSWLRSFKLLPLANSTQDCN